jgi:hypothetical protein
MKEKELKTESKVNIVKEKETENKIDILTLVLCIVLVSQLIVFAYLNSIGAGDTWWYLACGRYIVQNSTVPQADVFSFTFSGKQWINSEWLTNVVFYVIFKDFDRNGLAVFKIIMVTIILLLIIVRIYLKTGDYFLCLTGLLVCCVIGRIFLDIRAQLFTFIFILSSLLFVDFARRGKKWLLYILPLLVIPWVSFHGGFMYLLFIFGSLGAGELIYIIVYYSRKNNFLSAIIKLLISFYNAIEAIVRFLPVIIWNIFYTRPKKHNRGEELKDKNQFLEETPDTIIERRKNLILYIILFFITFFLSLLNPYFFGVYDFPFRVFTQPTFKETLEWIPPWRFNVPGFITPIYWPYAVFFAVFSIISIKTAYLGELFLSWLTLFMSLSSRRFIPLFTFVSIPLCMEAIYLSIGFRLDSKKLTKIISQIVVVILIIFMYISLFNEHIISTMRWEGSLFNYMTGNHTFPEDACDFVKKNNIKGKTFNYYNWGGYILWHLYPDMPIFIDGRAQGVYSPEIYDEYKYISRPVFTINEKTIKKLSGQFSYNRLILLKPLMNKRFYEKHIYDKLIKLNFSNSETGLIMGSCDYYLYWEEIMDRYGADIIFISKNSQDELAKLISQSNKWFLLYQDNVSVIFLRKCSKNQPYIDKYMEGKLYIPERTREYLLKQKVNR